MKKDIAKNKKSEEKKGREARPETVVYVIGLIILGYIALSGILLYSGINNVFFKKTARIIPYPAALSQSGFVTVGELESRLGSARKFYEEQDFSNMGIRIDFTTDDGRKRLEIKKKYILNKMIEDALIEKEAQKRGIKLTPDIISQEVDRQIKEYGSEEYTEENLKRLYGWSLEDFKKSIVKPEMYREKLFEKIKNEDASFQTAQKKITEAGEELEKTRDFESVVQKYSEGDSAKNKGELGWFSSDQMLPELANVAFSLEKGKTSEVIESSLGYHIVNIEDKKKENEIEKVRLRQIFVRTKTFGEWIQEKEKNLKVYIPLKEFRWNKNIGEVEFESEEMNKFEESLKTNFPGDISIMF